MKSSTQEGKQSRSYPLNLFFGSNSFTLYNTLLKNIFSIIGAVIVITGLYLLLWGKEDPQPESEEQEQCCTTHEDPMMQISAEP